MMEGIKIKKTELLPKGRWLWALNHTGKDRTSELLWLVEDPVVWFEFYFDFRIEKWIFTKTDKEMSSKER